MCLLCLVSCNPEFTPHTYVRKTYPADPSDCADAVMLSSRYTPGDFYVSMIRDDAYVGMYLTKAQAMDEPCMYSHTDPFSDSS